MRGILPIAPYSEIILKNILSVLGTILIMITTGCVTVPANYYQDGKSLSKGKFDGGVGLGFGRTVEFEISNFDSNGLVGDGFSDGSLLPVLNISGQYGLSPKFDIGAELFTSLSSYGFKLNGKYTLSDSLSKWGISIMPVIGYASGKVTGSGSEFSGGTLISSYENEITHNAFIGELPLLMSYHIDYEFAFTFGPRLYFYRLSGKDETKFISLDKVEINKAAQSLFSPGFSFGFQYRGFKPELTFVAVENVSKDEVNLTPYFGIGFFGWEAIEAFINFWD